MRYQAGIQLHAEAWSETQDVLVHSVGQPTLAGTSSPVGTSHPCQDLTMNQLRTKSLSHHTLLEGFARRVGGSGELKGGLQLLLDTLVSLLTELKLSLVGPWGFSPHSCPGADPAYPPAPNAPRAARLAAAGDEETKRGSAGAPGLHPCLQRDPEEPWAGAGDVWADARPSQRLLLRARRHGVGRRGGSLARFGSD